MYAEVAHFRHDGEIRSSVGATDVQFSQLPDFLKEAFPDGPERLMGW